MREQRIFAHTGPGSLLLIACILSGCSVRDTNADHSTDQMRAVNPRYAPGATVILGTPGSKFDVGLWLMYPDCTVDVTYERVPGGTHASVVGDVCVDDDVLYYKVAFSAAVRNSNRITTDNTWLEESLLSPETK